jgi:hypothetical protein
MTDIGAEGRKGGLLVGAWSRKGGAWSALGAVAICSPVLAQQAPMQETVSARSLDAELNVTEMFDSNVSRSDAQLAAARDLKRTDNITTPQLQANGSLPLGMGSLFFTGSAGYDFYQRNHVLDRERADIAGGGEAHLSSCLTRLTGDYSAHQANLAEVTDAAAPTQALSNFVQRESVELDVACGRSTGLRPSLTVVESASQNSAEQYKPLDNEMFTVSPALIYARPALGAIQVFGQFVDLSYDRSFQVLEEISTNPPTLGFVSVNNGFNIKGGGFRYDRNIGSRIQGNVTVSYTDLTPTSSLTHGFSGFTYGAEVTYAPSRLALHAKAGRATQPSNQIGSSYYIDDSYLADVKYTLGEKMVFDLGGSIEQRQYESIHGDPVTIITAQRVKSVFGDARYNFGRRWYVDLNAQLETRRVNLIAYNYTSARAGITIGLKY